MTRKEIKKALETLEDLQRLLTCYRHISRELTKANGIAIQALEKAEKYKWHDLRKDPNDLPKLEYCKQVVVVDYEHKAKVVYVSTLLSWPNEFFIAWKYIEPLEEVE